MFDRILDSLFGSQPKKLPEADAKLALTALLVRIAKSDGVYATAEEHKIREIVTERYTLTAPAAEELMASAEALEAEAPDTVRFTEAIKNAVPYEDRNSVVAAAWAVVLADGERADEEDALMRLISKFLGVTDMDSNLARKKAMS